MDPSTWTRAVGAPATFDQHCTTVLQRQICRQGARTWQRNTSPNEPRPIFTFSPNSSTGISSRSVSIVLPRPPPILASPTAGALIGGGKATPPRSSSTLMLLSISTTPVPQPAADPHSDAPQVTSPRPRQRARWSSHAAVGARESVAPGGWHRRAALRALRGRAPSSGCVVRRECPRGRHSQHFGLKNGKS